MFEKYITDEEVRKKLKELHESKYELKSILDSQNNKSSFVIDICGLPRTGKTNTVSKLLTFFRKANYRVLSTKEPAEIIKETEDSKLLTDKEFNDKTFDISKHQLEILSDKKPDIILQDRGVFDNYIWYQMMYERGEINFLTYLSKMENMNDVLKEDDQLYLMTADPEIIVARDYSDQIFLEARKKTTIEGVSKLREGMENLLTRVDSNNIFRIDTSSLTEADTAIRISNGIIDGMTKKLKKNKNM